MKTSAGKRRDLVTIVRLLFGVAAMRTEGPQTCSRHVPLARAFAAPMERVWGVPSSVWGGACRESWCPFPCDVWEASPARPPRPECFLDGLRDGSDLLGVSQSVPASRSFPDLVLVSRPFPGTDPPLPGCPVRRRVVVRDGPCGFQGGFWAARRRVPLRFLLFWGVCVIDLVL